MVLVRNGKKFRVQGSYFQLSADLSSTRSGESREETYASTLLSSLFRYLSTVSTTRVACLWCRILVWNSMLGLAIILKICISSWRKILRSIWKDLKTSKDWQNAQLRLSRKCVGHIVIVIWFKATSFWQSLIINQYWQYCRSLTQRSRKMGGGRLSVGAYSNDQEMLIFQDSDPRMSCMLCSRKVFS